MSIRIEEINVKNLGPIADLSWELDNINLVYGHNERGKSYLVEFLIHALFRAQRWDALRNQLGRGTVQVAGLGEATLRFSPEKDEKIEDYLTERRIGLPPDFSKLLVFRGSHIMLSGSGESDKVMLRRFLSHKELLEKIISDVGTVVNCQFAGYKMVEEDRRATGVKEREEYQQRLGKIKNLFTKISDKYFGGDLRQLQKKREKLEERREEMMQAKRYLAMELARKIDGLQDKAEEIKEGEINQILTDISALEKERVRQEQRKKEVQKLEVQTKHFGWLAQAVRDYEELALKAGPQGAPAWLMFGFIGILAASAVFILLGIKTLSVALLLAAAGAAVFYKFMEDRARKEFGAKEELANIRREFKKRFGEDLEGLTALKAKKESLESKYSKLQVRKEEAEEGEKDLALEKSRLAREVENLLGVALPPERWEKVLQERRRRKESIQREINRNRERLAALQVEKEDYLQEEPPLEYDATLEKDLEKRLEKVQEKIRAEEQSLERLKQEICAVTGLDFSTTWMVLIDALRREREGVEEKYKEITAEIMAKINVAQVVRELLTLEDEKIHTALDSPIIKELLPRVTTHYHDLYLGEHDQLVVSDAHGEFPVSEISDGAKEQVFLVLRLVLARQWFAEENLFLILDDAFIHSDKERKAELVGATMGLARSGWQIICLTFDDRVKKLFDKSGEDYNLLDLNEVAF